tara:strand:+ start:1101 stop:2144 length:1044 start_codon:yes stop_codon:yes gene_type:complete
MSSKIVIFKNDRIGDLIPSVSAINLIIEKNKDKEIVLYLSEINYKMKFLFNKKNVKVVLINYKLPLKNRMDIFYFFIKTKISKVYILRPKNFFFLLPIIFYFKKIKFYGLCLNGTKNYKRPIILLRKFLTKFVVNDRGTLRKRISREKLQLNLVNEESDNIFPTKDYNFEFSNILKKILPNNYFLIHYKKQMFEELEWGTDGLDRIVNEMLKYCSNVVLINDIKPSNDNMLFKKKYNWYDFKEGKRGSNNSKILYLENIDGIDMFNVIKLSKKTIACHGTITLLGNLTKVPILDLFHCKIKNKDDYHRNKNSFHEHMPNNKNYDFIIPNTNINKTIRKMQFSLKNGK